MDEQLELKLYHPQMVGCSDGGCYLVKNRGMVTNGGCSCSREVMRADKGREMLATIQYLRRQVTEMDLELRQLKARHEHTLMLLEEAKREDDYSCQSACDS